MSNTSDDRSSNCGFPDRIEAEGLNWQFGSESNCQCNPSASQWSGKTHFQGQSTEGGQGVTSGQKRKTIESVGKAKGNNNESGLTRHVIHEWSGRANVDFKYDKAKMDKSVNAAKKKRDESDCNDLKCTQCKESFRDERQLREHNDSKQHLAKARVKSESTTLGDLNTFACVRQFIREGISDILPAKQVTLQEQIQPSMPRAAAANEPPLGQILGPPAKQVTSQGQTRASLPRANQPTNEIPLGNYFDELIAGDFDPYESTKYPFPVLGEEIDIKGLDEKKDQATDINITKPQVEVDLKAVRLQTENGEKEKIRELKEKIREMVVELKKNETKGELEKGELGYKFDNNEYFRTMYVLEQQYSSVQELVANLVMCSFKVNRGKYGERQSNGGTSDEEKATKKRKKGSKKEEEGG